MEVIRKADTIETHQNVKCICGIDFCFNCGSRQHYPLSCDLFRKWNILKEKIFDKNCLENKKRSTKCPYCHFVCQNNGDNNKFIVSFFVIIFYSVFPLWTFSKLQSCIRCHKCFCGVCFELIEEVKAPYHFHLQVNHLANIQAAYYFKKYEAEEKKIKKNNVIFSEVKEALEQNWSLYQSQVGKSFYILLLTTIFLYRNFTSCISDRYIQ